MKNPMRNIKTFESYSVSESNQSITPEEFKEEFMSVIDEFWVSDGFFIGDSDVDRVIGLLYEFVVERTAFDLRKITLN